MQLVDFIDIITLAVRVTTSCLGDFLPNNVPSYVILIDVLILYTSLYHYLFFSDAISEITWNQNINELLLDRQILQNNMII